MKRCSTLVIREMKIKTTMRYHLTPLRMAIKKTRKKIWRSVEKRNTCVLLVGIYTGIVIMENSMVVPQKTTNRTAGDPAILM